jgi:hypothetical protein
VKRIELKIPPPPTIVELLGRFLLTPSEYRRVFDGHDPGDEDRNARKPLIVCSLRSGRLCWLDPNHFGPHSWER